MEIKILKVDDYRGDKIYVRQFGHVFEYLIVHQRQVYTMHNVFFPRWYRRLTKNQYNEKELEDGMRLTLAAARNTIDLLKDKKYGARKNAQSNADKLSGGDADE